jgi:hypothetical protein
MLAKLPHVKCFFFACNDRLAIRFQASKQNLNSGCSKQKTLKKNRPLPLYKKGFLTNYDGLVASKRLRRTPWRSYP